MFLGDKSIDESPFLLLKRYFLFINKSKRRPRGFSKPSGAFQKEKVINTVKPTTREQEVLVLICAGFTNEDIAEKLCISPTTVKGHRTNLLEKTSCKNTASLIMYAIKNKLIEME